MSDSNRHASAMCSREYNFRNELRGTESPMFPLESDRAKISRIRDASRVDDWERRSRRHAETCSGSGESLDMKLRAYCPRSLSLSLSPSYTPLSRSVVISQACHRLACRLWMYTVECVCICVFIMHLSREKKLYGDYSSRATDRQSMFACLIRS